MNQMPARDLNAWATRLANKENPQRTELNALNIWGIFRAENGF